MIERAIRFRTSDEEWFDNEEDAVRHETALNLADFLNDHYTDRGQNMPEDPVALIETLLRFYTITRIHT